jgi:hypothetical protein
MKKILVFLSHISEERELALCLRDEINDAYLNMTEFFISTDDGISIPLGKRWLDRISDGLKIADILIVLCSRYSVTRPWINFESGCGWVRDIPVIPICHSELKVSELPMPLSALQAIEANDERGLGILFGSVAEAIGCAKPKVNYGAIRTKIEAIEQRLTQFPKRSMGSSPSGSTFSKDSLVFKLHECHFRKMGQDAAGGATPIRSGNAQWIEYWFKIDIYNKSTENTGLMDLHIVLLRDGEVLGKYVPGRYEPRGDGQWVHRSPPVTAVTLPSQEWVEITFQDGFPQSDTPALKEASEIRLVARSVDEVDFDWLLTNTFEDKY